MQEFLDTYKIIICAQFGEKYNNFIKIIIQEHENITIINDLLSLKLQLLYVSNDVTTVFIDNLFFDQLDESTSSILRLNNCLCIVLFDEYRDTFVRQSYVYDMLECKNNNFIDNFLIRLKNDINSRSQLLSMEYEVKRYYEIGKKLSAEKNPEKLLEHFANTCMEITSCDACTIYVIVDNENNEWSTYEKDEKNKLAKFAVSKNNSMKLSIESNVSIISKNSIFGYTVMTGQSLKIDDVYNIQSSSPYQFNNAFDKSTGYTTKSILSVPMKDHRDRILGVIQLINKKKDDNVIAFDSKDETIVYSLAGQAAVTIENSILYRNMDYLLQEYKLITHEEITNRKWADDEASKMLSAVEQNPAAVVITDINGNIQYINHKFTELTGYTHKEVIAKNVSILKSGQHSKQFYEDFWETILSGQEWCGEFNNKKKNGKLYWESSSISCLKDETGNIKNFIAIKQDITNKKVISKRLEDKNIELQQTIKKLNEFQFQLMQREKITGIGQLSNSFSNNAKNPFKLIVNNYEKLKNYVLRYKQLLFIYKDFIDNYSILNVEEKNEQIEYISNYEKDNNINFLLDDLFKLINNADKDL